MEPVILIRLAPCAVRVRAHTGAKRHGAHENPEQHRQRQRPNAIP